VGWEVDTIPSKLIERRNSGFANPQSPWKAWDIVQPMLNVPGWSGHSEVKSLGCFDVPRAIYQPFKAATPALLTKLHRG
jgi:hypothetical protein